MMQAKAPIPLDSFRVANLPSLVRSYLQWSHLKQLYRQGWLRRGIEAGQCESVADHVFAVAVLSMFVVDAHSPELDREKVLRMALLHDLGEVYAGDLTPADGVTRAEKHRLEAAAVRRVVADLEDGDAYLAVWEEYEKCLTPEARLVHEVDRLEMGLQAVVYEQRTGTDLGEFLASTAEGLFSPALVGLLEALEGLRRPGDGATTTSQAVDGTGIRAKEQR